MNGRSATSVDRHVGARLRVQRLDLAMSQSELGEKLGVSFQQVQKYEQGSNRVGASRLFQLGAVLGVPVSYFFEGLDADGQPPFKTSDEDCLYSFIASPDGLALASAFRGIGSQVVRRSILELIRALADQ